MADEKKKPGRPAGSKAKSKKATKKEMERLAAQKRLRDEIWSIAMIAMGAFLLVAYWGKAGGLGAFMSSLTTGLFGMIAYLLPFGLIAYGVMLFMNKNALIETKTVVCLSAIVIMLTVINSCRYITPEDGYSFEFFRNAYETGATGGGLFGMFLGLTMVKFIGQIGLYILSIAGVVVCAMVLMNTPLSHVADRAIERREERRAQREEEEEILATLSELEEGERAAARERLEEEHRLLEEASPIDVPSFLRKDSQPSTRKIEARKGLREADLSPAQLKIMDYMKDDELFDLEEASHGFGLEPGEALPAGFGLHGGESAEDLTDSHAVDFSALDELAAMPEPPDLPDLPEIREYQPEPAYAEQPEPVSAPEPVVAPQPVAKAPSVQLVKPEKPAASPVEDLKISIEGKTYHTYKIPSIELLNKVTVGKNIGEQAALQAKALKLEETLKNFGVNAKVIQVTKGPAVTRYEIQPNTGVKVSSIVRLADDIALNLEAKSIRMEAPIPGKPAVGIEVENDRVNMVSIREIVESGEFRNAKSKITFAVGKDIAGNAIVADLKSMPHMLIAGSTGSGKSVCINSLIISILYKAKPDEVKFVLIDPKVVELNNYNGIPHLLIPVVTEPSKAAAALNWAVAEMTDRYKKFAEEGVRDLASYNEKMKEKQDGDAPALPQIVIIIDELADLMMAAPSQVEEAICRLAQMARAAGMHLIVATQRPSVDIITGVIKANIPSRIAFAVSSQVDSRTILDMGGAEKLVGKGDMLFNPLGVAKPTRVQGCFISDTEVHKVIEFLKEQAPETDYNPDVIHSIEKVQTADTKDEDGDELLADAIETVVRAEQASASMLQRRFRVGYNRAARLIDMMEGRGIIGPQDGSRPRKVLITLDELMAMDAKTEETPAAPEPVQAEMPVAEEIQ